jgi:hypothetical protein
LCAGVPGGYVTPGDRLLAPNQNPQNRQGYADRFWPYDPTALGSPPMPGGRIFRGLIGAKTRFSCGKAGVGDFAKAAVDAGLDFLVFADDFRQLTPQKLEELNRECHKYSSREVQLFAGFSIRNNIGNSMFFFSPEPVWIPPRIRPSSAC